MTNFKMEFVAEFVVLQLKPFTSLKFELCLLGAFQYLSLILIFFGSPVLIPTTSTFRIGLKSHFPYMKGAPPTTEHF